MIQFCVTNGCELTAPLSWAHPHRDDLQAWSEAEGKPNVNYRRDLRVRRSLRPRRLLLMNYPLVRHQFSSSSFYSLSPLPQHKRRCGSQTEMIFRHHTRPRSRHSPCFMKAPCSVSQQINQTRLATEVERAEGHKWKRTQRDPPGSSSNSRILGLLWRTSLIYYSYFCTLSENKPNLWVKVIYPSVDPTPHFSYV